METDVKTRTLTGGLLEQPVESKQKNWDSDEKGREEQAHDDQDDRRQRRVLVVSGGVDQMRLPVGHGHPPVMSRSARLSLKAQPDEERGHNPAVPAVMSGYDSRELLKRREE
jgi:hypothetical protein